VLKVPDPAKGSAYAVLQATTYQGVLRGLETFSQLVLLSVLVRLCVLNFRAATLLLAHKMCVAQGRSRVTSCPPLFCLSFIA
jgi:hypothetical protein